MSTESAPAVEIVAAPVEDKMERLMGVDLFSGCGGISVGVAPFARAIQYCEWDKYCQSVLLQRMAEGRLDMAPIHSDVRSLHISPVVKPNFIFGGFPCQDISSIGLQKGIAEGARSSMFYQVMRIVDESPSIEVVFLENVANILNCGIKEVVEECSKRGFTMQWTLRSALAQGAPHVRSRWFLLACRGGGAERVASTVESLKDDTAENDVLVPGNAWRGTEPLERVSYRPAARADVSYDDHWSSRCQALGNAVVPQVVRQAFVDLALASKRWSQYVDLLGDTAVPIGDLKYPYPESSIVSGGMLYTLPKRRVPPQRHEVDIVTPGGPKANGDYIKIDNYPTPRRGITHASTLTDRSVRDLPTILVYCKATADLLREQGYEPPPEKQLHSMLVPNVNYLEWMMGYPRDWTRIDHSEGAAAIPQPPSRAAIARSAAAAGADNEDDGDCDSEEIVPDNEDEERVPTSKKSVPAAKKRAAGGGASRLHGMHVYMREHPGKDVEQVAKLWRTLTAEEKAVYSERAKQMNLQQQKHQPPAAVPPPSLSEEADADADAVDAA